MPPKKVKKLYEEGIFMELDEPSPPKEASGDAPADPKVTPHEFDFDLDPRLPMHVQNTGPAEDTVEVQVNYTGE